MTKQEFQKLTEDHVLLLDGATGSNLMKAGMPRGVCTESWVLEHKDVIQSLPVSYTHLDVYKRQASRVILPCFLHRHPPRGGYDNEYHKVPSLK